MSVGKAVVYANDRHYGDKIAKAIDEISEATNAALLKELEATKAELASEREKCMLIAQDLKWENQLSLKLQESKAELEAAKAELAAERARPRGGVAWAIRLLNGELATYNNVTKLFATKCEAERFIQVPPQLIGSIAVPYPQLIGSIAVPYPLGADELKAAIERAEKAEARVAAQEALLESANNTHEEWVKAANATTEGVIWIQSPCELAAHVKGLETKLAALKASLAKVPPLDRKRVLSTASIIARKWKRDEPFIEELEFLASYDEFGMAIPYEIENFSDQPPSGPDTDDFTDEANSLPTGVAEALHEIAIEELGHPVPMPPRRKIGTVEIKPLAALKAALAEVPPLDKWRVLATAMAITQYEFHEAESDSLIEAAWISAQNALQILLKLAGQDKTCRYEIN